MGESKGKGDAFLKSLYAAYFVDSRNIAEISVLSEIADTVGLPAEDVGEVLRGPGLIRTRWIGDWALAEQLNILVLPTFLMKGERPGGCSALPQAPAIAGKSRC